MADQEFSKTMSHPLEARARDILKKLDQPYLTTESAVLHLTEFCLMIAVANSYDPPLTEDRAWDAMLEYPEWNAIQILKRDHAAWPTYLEWLTVEEGKPLPGAKPYWREHHDPAPNDPNASKPFKVIPTAELPPLELNVELDYKDYRTATDVIETIMMRLMSPDFEQTIW